MITLIFSLLILTLIFGVAFTITGALLKAVLWMFVALPIGLCLWALGLACCCTIILIPLGVILFKAGLGVMVPGC